MCGIVGYWGCGDIQRMLDTISHRGPDHEGKIKFLNLDNDAEIALGIQQLQVIDLKTGKQPIYNEDKKICIVYNGEIFNFQRIRADLHQKGHVFSTASDTEVIIHAYEQWGERCVDHFIGQFAFAIYDQNKKALFIARDRMGEKPLYYARRNGSFFFASEIKALLTQVDTAPEIGDEFFAFEQASEGATIFRGIHELPRACYMIFDGESLTFTKYWEIPKEKSSERRPIQDWADEIRDLLVDSVTIRLISDVPLGVALSGGIDSAAIACIAKPEKVFTCNFPLGPHFDELEYASIIARHIGAEHFIVKPTPEDMIIDLPNIIWHLDYPIATASPIGEFSVTREAAKHVKVLLGGQGADELFGSYARYLVLKHEYETGHIPELENYKPMMRHLWAFEMFGDMAFRYFELLRRNSVKSPDRHRQTVKKHFDRFEHIVDSMGYTDIHLTLPSLIQMNDRACAAFGIENRSPFLDHRLVELAFRMPAEYKIVGFETKTVLKRALRGLVPDEILERRDKKGLVVPFNQWIDGPLASWNSALQASLSRRMRFKGSATRGEFDRSTYTAICLELWFQRFFPHWTNEK